MSIPLVPPGAVAQASDRTQDPVADLTDVLVRSLRSLGQAGDPDAASRLAAKAWWALRDQHPREAERINGAMHFLARLPESGAEGAATPSRPSETREPARAPQQAPQRAPQKETA